MEVKQELYGASEAQKIVLRRRRISLVPRRLEGDAHLACLGNGRWNGTRPHCVALGCEHPGQPRGGATESTGLRLGEYTASTRVLLPW